MAVPKKRTSRSKRNMRRSHDALTLPNGVICIKCSALRLRHRACGECGYYKGRWIKGSEGYLNQQAQKIEDVQPA